MNSRELKKKTVTEPYGPHTLPKMLKVICIANNEAEQTPKIPRHGSRTYLALLENDMIKHIEFRQGPEDYCLELIRHHFSIFIFINFSNLHCIDKWSALNSGYSQTYCTVQSHEIA